MEIQEEEDSVVIAALLHESLPWRGVWVEIKKYGKVLPVL